MTPSDTHHNPPHSKAPQPATPRHTIAGRIARIEFCDAARRNALDAGALAALVEAIRQTAAAPHCDALVLAGDGPAFCAGFDLAGCAEEPQRVEVLLSLLSDAVAALRALDIPGVARVQVDDGRAGLRCADCGVRDLLRGDRDVCGPSN